MHCDASIHFLGDLYAERLRAGEAGRAGMLAESIRRKETIKEMESRVDMLQAEVCF